MDNIIDCTMSLIIECYMPPLSGMNEIAAVLLYVMSVDPERAESDAFWCFSEMMVVPWLSQMHVIAYYSRYTYIHIYLDTHRYTSNASVLYYIHTSTYVCNIMLHIVLACFLRDVQEIKEGFMQTMDHSGEGL